MTREQTRDLVPGQKLRWRVSYVGESTKPTAEVDFRSPSILFGRTCGDVVEFISFTEQQDWFGVPIVRILTKTGEQIFSAGYLEVVPTSQ